MAKNETKKGADSDLNDEGWNDAQMPLSAEIEGWWDRRIGDVLHATVIGTDETQYGPYFIAKVKAPIHIKSGDDAPRLAKPGTVIAFSYNAIWRDVSKAVAKGPVEVKTSPLESGTGKRKFDYSVKYRAAF